MLEVKNLSFAVTDAGKQQEIIDHVSFTLEDGKFLVVTGPNGGGKSTLARLIMGIERPSEGSIIYNGEDITPLGITERAKKGIGYAFQQPPRFKGMTVRHLLSLARGGSMNEEECCSYLSSVGLCAREYINREVDASLSGGEVKRIEIATLLARDTGLAIFDEPEAGIDLWSFSMLVSTFRTFRFGRLNSVILISHQERIMRIADEIMVLSGGKVSAFGPRDAVLPDLLGQLQNDCTFKPKEACELG